MNLRSSNASSSSSSSSLLLSLPDFNRNVPKRLATRPTIPTSLRFDSTPSAVGSSRLQVMVFSSSKGVSPPLGFAAAASGRRKSYTVKRDGTGGPAGQCSVTVASAKECCREYG